MLPPIAHPESCPSTCVKGCHTGGWGREEEKQNQKLGPGPFASSDPSGIPDNHPPKDDQCHLDSMRQLSPWVHSEGGSLQQNLRTIANECKKL